jgi:3-oxoisoapionate kinase
MEGVIVEGQRKWLGYYGDDFTGSTDAMEALTMNGVKTILFVQPPTEEMLGDQRFIDFQAIGIAGVSRALDPISMENELLTAFDALKKAKVMISHYKTCSTFDSSPEVGSIGKAIEMGQEIFQNRRYIPLIVGVPVLNRYTVFGNHFATMENVTYRLDRHPVMSIHPMTPMDEADLGIHLSKQTSIELQSMTVLDLAGTAEEILTLLEKKLMNHPSIILFDVLNEGMLAKIGDLLLEETSSNPFFTVGSSGIEYALAAAWKQKGLLETGKPNWPTLEPAEPLLVVSGSCSPVTEKQIKYGINHQFIGLKVASEDLTNPEMRSDTCKKIIHEAAALLDRGESVIIYTALGPEDPSIDMTKGQLRVLGQKPTDTSKILGEQLGLICKELIQSQGLKRVLVAGGDTSGYVLKELEVFAMEMIKPITPGAPLCVTYSYDPIFNGLEITLKGGQMGGEDFFLKVRDLT